MLAALVGGGTRLHRMTLEVLVFTSLLLAFDVQIALTIRFVITSELFEIVVIRRRDGGGNRDGGHCLLSITWRIAIVVVWLFTTEFWIFRFSWIWGIPKNMVRIQRDSSGVLNQVESSMKLSGVNV